MAVEGNTSRREYRPAYTVMVVFALLAIVLSGIRARGVSAATRNQALANALERRGLGVDVDGMSRQREPL